MKIAVMLAGCGRYDGSEVHESVLTLLAISQSGAHWHAFAPDAEAPVYDHRTGEETGQDRNMLVEAARIARGRVDDLAMLNPGDWDALIIPGGTGVARNLSNWATAGADATARPDVRKAIIGMHNAGKPIGFICIAPHLGALLLPGVTLTVGETGGASSRIEQAGAIHKAALVTECIVDEGRRVASCPAYMDGSASLAEVFAGIEKLVVAIVKMANSRPKT